MTASNGMPVKTQDLSNWSNLQADTLRRVAVLYTVRCLDFCMWRGNTSLMHVKTTDGGFRVAAAFHAVACSVFMSPLFLIGNVVSSQFQRQK